MDKKGKGSRTSDELISEIQESIQRHRKVRVNKMKTLEMLVAEENDINIVEKD